ncbi:hypothetical protein O164_08975 [Pseudomonas taiwanensis SJ9]|uniref:Uncharacterized protein n=1 Tax=Pseudomonas taiwanensis SJ9 TaxID=1388762 RepID=V7DEK6_9PSED|nr:hypothetical protein O164_08975 [Pseudomonas taiwanensis SJ9]
MRHRCDACAMQLKGQAPALEGDRLPQGTLRRGKLHKLETLRALLESALVQVQMPAEPRSLH